MAKPELADGWAQLAHELDAALEVADFTKAERIVLSFVKCQVFGAAKLRSASLVATKIALEGDWGRAYIVRGIRDLVRSKVLIQACDGSYRLNKYYRNWTFSDGTCHGDSNGSRFSNGELNRIKRAPTIAKEAESNQTQKRVQPDSNLSPTRLKPESNQTHPLIGTRPSEDFKKTSEEKEREDAHARILDASQNDPHKAARDRLVEWVIAKTSQDPEDMNRDYFADEIQQWLEAGHSEAKIRSTLHIPIVDKGIRGPSVFRFAAKVISDPKNAISPARADGFKPTSPHLPPGLTDEQIARSRVAEWLRYEQYTRKAEAREKAEGVTPGRYRDLVEVPKGPRPEALNRFAFSSAS